VNNPENAVAVMKTDWFFVCLTNQIFNLKNIRMRNIIAFIYVSIFLGIAGLHGQEGLIPNHLQQIKNVTEIAVSEDGSLVAYLLLSPVDLLEGPGTFYRELFLYDVKKFYTTPLITGKVSVSSIAWVPGGKAISFLQSNANTKGQQVFNITTDGSKEIRQITDHTSSIIAYEYADAGAILFTAQQAPSPDKQRLTKQGVDLYVFEEEQRHIELYRYHIATKQTTPLITNKSIYEFTVSPDGKMVAATVSDQQLVDYSYMFKHVTIADALNGNQIMRISDTRKLGDIAWSPDNKRIAVVAASSLQDAVAGSLFLIDITPGEGKFEELTNHVKGLELSVISLLWEDPQRLLYCAEESVDITVTRLNLKDGSKELVMPGGLAVFQSASLHQGILYMAGNTWQHPNELMQYDIKKRTVKKLSDHNDGWLKGVSLGRQEKVSYKARDGKLIEGVLNYPLNYEEGKRYPLIVYIHGGPEACVRNGWNNGYSSWGQFAASRGYFVFSPNYRASSGRGVDFTMAGYGDLAGTEYNDVLDGIDFLIAEGKVDEKRVGIGGGSYGGYFAAWSATRHSQRFAASVVFVGISNQVSKRKTTDIPWEDYHVHWGFWTWENWKKVWDVSPVKFVSMSQTPTLILHGDDDPRIPVSQGLELYRGLKLHGKAPVRFVRYPGEGHGNRKNYNRYDFLVRTLEWYDYYLITNQGSQEMPAKYIDYPVH
jgi:dipeptidyl aminopeptidase/acylaminoacyl peptidase